MKPALIVVDAQESFRRRPYFRERDVPAFLHNVQCLSDRCEARGIPVVQIFHHEPGEDPDNPFCAASGWLRRECIGELLVTGIRTEQCCETTTRHASDVGFSVRYVTDATLTFPMRTRSGREVSAEEIRERTEMVLDGRFARIVTTAAALG